MVVTMWSLALNTLNSTHGTSLGYQMFTLKHITHWNGREPMANEVYTYYREGYRQTPKRVHADEQIERRSNLLISALSFAGPDLRECRYPAWTSISTQIRPQALTWIHRVGPVS